MSTVIEAKFGWDDLRFPFSGNRLDVSSGRLDYDFFNGGVSFQDNARYPNEPVSMLAQLPHTWIEGSEIRPHMHWIMQSANMPNWLLAYKIYDNGAATTIDTDYSNHTLAAYMGNAFPYTSGTMNQITMFPNIDMTGFDISCQIHFVLFRDSNNTSGLFAGSDPSNDDELNLEFDVHYQVNSFGSRQEYIK